MTSAPSELRRTAFTTTDTTALRELADDADATVRRGVAANSATEADVVERLATDADASVRAAVARRDVLDRYLALRLTSDDSAAVRKVAWRRDDLDAALLLERALVTPPPTETWLMKLADRITTDAALANAAARCDSPRLQLLAARGPLTDESAVRLAQLRSIPIDLTLSGNAAISSAALRLLVDRADFIRQLAVARLVADRGEYRWLRKNVGTPAFAVAASLPTATPALLAWWRYRYRTPAIRRAVAANPATPRPLLRRLRLDNRWDVRVALVDNPSISDRTFRKIAGDPLPAVQHAVAGSLRSTAEILATFRHAPGFVMMQAAANPNSSQALIEAYAAHPVERMVAAVACRHPAMSPEKLRSIGSDLDQPGWLLAAVASNPNCPDDLRDQLLTWLAIGGAATSDATFDPLTGVGHPGDPKDSFEAAVATLARRDDAATHVLAAVRSHGVADRRLDAITIARAARDPSPMVRARAAGYGWRPTLKELAHDAIPTVASTARYQLEHRSDLVGPKLVGWSRPVIGGAVGLAAAVARVLGPAGSPDADRPDARQIQASLVAQRREEPPWMIEVTSIGCGAAGSPALSVRAPLLSQLGQPQRVPVGDSSILVDSHEEREIAILSSGFVEDPVATDDATGQSVTLRRMPGEQPVFVLGASTDSITGTFDIQGGARYVFRVDLRPQPTGRCS